MLKEWAPFDVLQKKVTTAIKNHFDGKELRTHRGLVPAGVRSLKWYESELGLPYTSSSSFAALWITNVTLYTYPEGDWHYIGFSIGEDGKVYATLFDNESPENEKVIAI